MSCKASLCTYLFSRDCQKRKLTRSDYENCVAFHKSFCCHQQCIEIVFYFIAHIENCSSFTFLLLRGNIQFIIIYLPGCFGSLLQHRVFAAQCGSSGVWRRAQQLCLAGSVALRHVGSQFPVSRVPCIARQILNHWTTREVLLLGFLHELPVHIVDLFYFETSWFVGDLYVFRTLILIYMLQMFSSYCLGLSFLYDGYLSLCKSFNFPKAKLFQSFVASGSWLFSFKMYNIFINVFFVFS